MPTTTTIRYPSLGRAGLNVSRIRRVLAFVAIVVGSKSDFQRAGPQRRGPDARKRWGSMQKKGSLRFLREPD